MQSYEVFFYITYDSFFESSIGTDICLFDQC